MIMTLYFIFIGDNGLPYKLVLHNYNSIEKLLWSYMLSLSVFFGQVEFPSRPTSQTPLLAETEQQMLQDLMSEAMEETDGQHAPGLQQNGEAFCLVKIKVLAP